MLRYTFDLDKEADAIELAIKEVLQDDYRTGDIMGKDCKQVGCIEMGNLIVEKLK